MRRSAIATLMAVVVWSCGGEGEVPEQGAAATPAGVESARTTVLPDSLLLTLPGGYSVWWTLSREVASAGAGDAPESERCVERAVEIRHAEIRRLVPLLYTRVPPVRVSDTTIRATISTRCQDGVDYLVDIRTADPAVAP